MFTQLNFVFLSSHFFIYLLDKIYSPQSLFEMEVTFYLIDEINRWAASIIMYVQYAETLHTEIVKT
jgi:hypothetical protein